MLDLTSGARLPILCGMYCDSNDDAADALAAEHEAQADLDAEDFGDAEVFYADEESEESE